MLKCVVDMFRELFRVRALEAAFSDFLDPRSLRVSKEWLGRWRCFIRASSDRTMCPFLLESPIKAKSLSNSFPREPAPISKLLHEVRYE